tara:strand:- start:34983 stop:35642 length:660 start_codon:yes stop_codon:yes gene_type:complete
MKLITLDQLNTFFYLINKLSLNFSKLAKESAEIKSSLKVPKDSKDEPILKIHKMGSDSLRTNAERISKADQSIREMAKNMLQSMYFAKGIGLAAPQIGISKQLIVIDLNLEEAATPPVVLINPEIISVGASLNTYEEGCLSIPGIYLDVVRPSTVKIKYRDEMGRPRKMNSDGLLARCIQHEIDHLNGVLFVDKVSDKDLLRKELANNGYKLSDVKSDS